MSIFSSALIIVLVGIPLVILYFYCISLGKLKEQVAEKDQINAFNNKEKKIDAAPLPMDINAVIDRLPE